MLKESDLQKAPSPLKEGTKSPGPGFVVAVVALIASLVAIGLSIGALSNSNTKAAPSPAPAPAPAPAAAAPAAAAPRPAAPAATAVPNVDVSVHDFAIDASVTSVPAGLIDFNVTDKGPTPHEFLIFKADMAPDQLPLGTDGRVDESIANITKVFDSGDNIAVSTTKVMHAALTAGKYVLVCNLPAHYKAGMHTAFTVS